MNDDTAWMAEGSCRDKGPGLWFSFDDAGQAAARAVCAACPVLAQCRAYSLDPRHVPRLIGIFAGLDENQRENQRAKMRPRRPAGRQQPDHGTRAGYNQHRRLGEAPCTACLEAKRQASRLERES